MFHKNLLGSAVATNPDSTQTQTDSARLSLVSVQLPAEREASSLRPSSLLELAVITSRRCSTFFAEAAVLVLVFGILDFFILKGRIELHWIIGALAISLGLLAASIATDFGAHRWQKAHP